MGRRTLSNGLPPFDERKPYKQEQQGIICPRKTLSVDCRSCRKRNKGKVKNVWPAPPTPVRHAEDIESKQGNKEPNAQKDDQRSKISLAEMSKPAEGALVECCCAQTDTKKPA